MLLIHDQDYTFDNAIKNSDFAVCLFLINVEGNSLLENMQRMAEVVWTSRDAGCGTIGIEGRWIGRDERVFFGLSRGGESHVVGLGRKLLRQSKLAESWFLFRRSKGDDLIIEGPDRSRQICTLTEAGFALPDGRGFDYLKAYTPAQNNTAYLHAARNIYSPDHLCNKAEHHLGS